MKFTVAIVAVSIAAVSGFSFTKTFTRSTSTALNEHFLGGFQPVASTPATNDASFSGFGRAVAKPDSEEVVEFAIPHKPVFSGFAHNNGEIGASLLGEGYIVPEGAKSTPAYSTVGHTSSEAQPSLLAHSGGSAEPVFSTPGKPVFSGFAHSTDSAPPSLLNSSPPKPPFSGFGGASGGYFP